MKQNGRIQDQTPWLEINSTYLGSWNGVVSYELTATHLKMVKALKMRLMMNQPTGDHKGSWILDQRGNVEAIHWRKTHLHPYPTYVTTKFWINMNQCYLGKPYGHWMWWAGSWRKNAVNEKHMCSKAKRTSDFWRNHPRFATRHAIMIGSWGLWTNHHLSITFL